MSKFFKLYSICGIRLVQCGPRLRAWRAALRFEKASRAAKIKSRSGWSNFSTLVGHFSKLFEFARLNRLKTLIFVSKSGCSLKKKKGLQLESISEIPILLPKSGCSLKKKKDLQLESIYEAPIFVPKS